MEIDPWTDRIGGFIERHPSLMRRLGDWESGLLRDRLAAVRIDRPIYIAGVARSGSTILLELLARHPHIATHRYRDFPGLHLPWAWNWFMDRAARPRAPEERAHADRILVTPQSPEAFEEVLWMSYFPMAHDPRTSSLLDERTENPAFEAFYRDHIRKLLLMRGGRRYLAKGNYNLTRLAYLKKLFPDARFIVPVRDPLWHVASLIKQHRLFCDAARADARVTRHLRRSGHFEFGLDRRAPNVGEDATRRIERLWGEAKEAEGWAACWALLYGHVAKALAARPALAAATMIVRYEDVCARPGETMAKVLDHCGLSDLGIAEAAERIVSPPDYYSPSFSPEEERAIRGTTRETARLFGYEM